MTINKPGTYYGTNLDGGDKVCIMGGTYNGRIILRDFNGDQDNPILIQNCGGLVFITNYAVKSAIDILNSTYFKFSGKGVSNITYGVKVDTSGHNGMYVGDKSTNFEVEGVEIRRTGFAGIMSKTDPTCDDPDLRGFVQRDSWFHDNYIHHTKGEGFYIGYSNYTTSGFNKECEEGKIFRAYPHRHEGVKIYNNRIEHAGWDAIQIGATTKGGEIYGNTIINPAAARYPNHDAGIQLGAYCYAWVYNNKILPAAGQTYSTPGHGIVSAAVAGRFFNNIIVKAGDATRASIQVKDVTHPDSSVYIQNNTIISTGKAAISIYGSNPTGHKLNNNIMISSTGKYIIDTSSPTDTTKNYRSTVNTNVKFVNPSAHDYHLQSGSVAINKGLNAYNAGVRFDHDNRPRPVSGNFEQGAFEYASYSIATGTTTPNPVCTNASVSIPFTVGQSFNSGNTFTAQLSNASGSFTSPVNIGTLSGTTSGTITGTIPSSTAAGSGYKIRVIASSPAATGTASPAFTVRTDCTTGGCAMTITGPGTYTGTSVLPGQKVCITAGAYNGRIVLKDFHGTEASPILITNTGGPVVITNHEIKSAIDILNCSFFKLSGKGVSTLPYGIKVDSSGHNGVYVGAKSTNFEIEGIEVRRTGFAGIMSKTDPSCTDLDLRSFVQKNSIFHDNYIHDTEGEGFYIGYSNYTPDGFDKDCGGPAPVRAYPHRHEGVKIYNNVIERSGWDAIQLGATTKGGEIYGNTIIDPAYLQYASHDSGIQLGAYTYSVVYNNKILPSPGKSYSTLGNAINSAAVASRIFNNLIVNAGDATRPAIQVKNTTHPDSSVFLINNTIITSGKAAISIFGSNPTGHKINNNILVSANGKYIIDVNSVTDTTKNYRATSVEQVQFVSPSTHDFHLSNNSPCLNRGMNATAYGVKIDLDNKPRPTTGAFEQGVYEFSYSIVTTNISPNPLCSGKTVTVPFTVSQAFNSGNVFTAQLSDASGSFATPVTLGTLTGTGSGSITGTIPSSTGAASGYKIRVVASNPATTGASSGNLTVSTTCSTNDCNCTMTINAPGTYSGATLEGGDRVCIMAGNYNGRIILKDFHGEQNNPILFTNCGGLVTINNLEVKSAIDILGCSFFKFSGKGVAGLDFGIKVDSSGHNGMYVGSLSTDFEVEGVEIQRTGFAGIMSKTDPSCDDPDLRYFVQKNSIFHDNYIHDTEGEGFYIGYSNYTPDGFNKTCENGAIVRAYPHKHEGVSIYNNVVERAGWDGIQIGATTKGGAIYNNTIIHPATERYPAHDSGIQLGAYVYCNVYGNMILPASGQTYSTPGNGIVSAAIASRIFNNVIVNAGDATRTAIQVKSTTHPDSSVYIINNTIITSGKAAISIFGATTTGHKLNNNIMISANAKYIIDTSSPTDTTKNYRSTTNTNVRFVSPSTHDYHLQSNSVAINKGKDVSVYKIRTDIEGNPRPYGTAYDIGAYEYIGGSMASDFAAEEFDPDRKTHIYPNPARERFTIKVDESDAQFQVQLIDATGMTIRTIDNCSGSVELETRQLTSGIYFVNVIKRDGIVRKKVSIVK